jgi:hypothetical protein
MSEYITIENARVKSARLYLCDHGVWTDGHFHALRAITGPLDDWSKVAGSYVRVRRDGHKILAIGHIVEDRWFDFDAVIKAQNEGK